VNGRAILDPEGKQVLKGFLTRRTLMAFDYDGTLAPIVNDPSEARMSARTAELLQAIARRYPTVVISGRARRDVQRFLLGIPLLEVIGNHGFESFGAPPRAALRTVAGWRDVLKPLLAEAPGIFIEDKRFSLAIHYRQAPDATAAEQRISAAVESLGPVRIVGGKAVVNVLPAEAPHKGNALLRLCERLGCPHAIYVGDDDTDEDVFALNQPDRILTVRVGSERSSAATYRLHRQADIELLLSAMLAVGEGARSITASAADSWR